VLLNVGLHFSFAILQNFLFLSNNRVVNGELLSIVLNVSLESQFISNGNPVETSHNGLLVEFVQFFLSLLFLFNLIRLGLLKEFVQFFLILLFVVVVSDLELINPLDSLLGLFFDKLINNFHWCWSNEVASFLSLLSFGWVV